MDASATNSGSSDSTVRCVPQPEQSQQGSLPLPGGYSEQPSERFGNSHCYPSGQTFGLRWRSHARAHSRKNAEKHGVNQSEAEEIFFNEPLWCWKTPNTARPRPVFMPLVKLMMRDYSTSRSH